MIFYISIGKRWSFFLCLKNSNLLHIIKSMEELDRINVNEETVVTYGDILNIIEGTKHMSNWLFENMGKLSQEQVRSLFAPLATTFTCAVRLLPPKVSKKIYKEMSNILGVDMEQIVKNPERFEGEK